MNLEEKKKYQKHEMDTGSTSYQIFLIEEKIRKSKLHLKLNPKDIPTKRKLLKKIARKKSLMKFLKKNDFDIYKRIRE